MNKLFEEVEEFVPEKFYTNLFDEMEYHGYEFVEQEVDDIVRIVFKKTVAEDTAPAKATKATKGAKAAEAKPINVLILFHERENRAGLVARKNDFDQNVKRYLSADAENWVIYDSEDVKKSMIKHTKAMTETEIIFRGKQSFIRNIKNVIPKGGYTIATEKEIKAMETMRALPSFAAVAPLISNEDVVCFMLRAKKGEFIRRSNFDPTIKSFTVKYFLVH